jgi:hypothetical protein
MMTKRSLSKRRTVAGIGAGETRSSRSSSEEDEQSCERTSIDPTALDASLVLIKSFEASLEAPRYRRSRRETSSSTSTYEAGAAGAAAAHK